MSNTTYSGLPYPVLGVPPNIPQDFSNLAIALDQKVIVTVASAGARTALSNKYDNMIVLQADTDRHYRWNAAASRWDYLAGPWFTWTPTLVASGGTVTAGGSSRGTYIITEGRIRFLATFQFLDPINGQAGPLVLQMPTGVVAKSSEPEQDSITCNLLVGTISRWAGVGLVGVGGTQVVPFFPISSSNCTQGQLVNATSAGATGTGTPTIGGSYPLVNGSRLSIWGEYELSSWPAL